MIPYSVVACRPYASARLLAIMYYLVVELNWFNSIAYTAVTIVSSFCVVFLIYTLCVQTIIFVQNTKQGWPPQPPDRKRESVYVTWWKTKLEVRKLSHQKISDRH